MMTINELITKAHESAKSKGFWDKERNTGELLMLIVSECGEALEAHRKGRFASLDAFDMELRPTMSFVDASGAIGHRLKESESPCFGEVFRKHIKDSFSDELADIVIRIADYCGGHGVIPAVSDQVLAGVCRIQQNVGTALLGITRSVTSVGRPDGSTTEEHFGAALIGVFALANDNAIDLWRHIELKLAYNATRPALHGKNY